MINTYIKEIRLVAIYVITNVLNNKKYVGISTRLKRRWRDHCKFEENARLTVLQNAIKKYGKDNFNFEHIADAFSWQDACELEKCLIVELNTKKPLGYNATDGGDGTPGFKHSEDECKRRSERCPTRDPRIAKMNGDRQKGKKRPEVSGENNGMYGRTGTKSHMLKHIIIATNINTNEQIILAGAKEIAQAGFNRGHVYSCAKNIRKSHLGYTFKFKEN